MRKINIAIDGPSAAGKSTISDLIAKQLNYTHLDTGAMYRAVAYAALNAGLTIEDEDNIVALINELNLEMPADGRVILDGKDISDDIRTNEMSIAASDVSKLLGVLWLKLEDSQLKLALGKEEIVQFSHICRRAGG